MNHLIETRNCHPSPSLDKQLIKLLGILLVIVFPISSSYSQCPSYCSGTNSFLGIAAGDSTSTGFSNSFFGHDAGKSITTGNKNSFFGQDAGESNSTGIENSFFGEDAGLNNNSGSQNSFFGNSAGGQITTGSRVICLGYESGPSAGQSDVPDRLYIDVEESDDPLIYGEFDNDLVRINGEFEVTAGLANPSSRTLKEQFVAMDASTILAKLSTLEVQQWSYKNRPGEKHVGPVAEDFYELFALGDGNIKISTIDADGIMMLAIQALKDENEMLTSKLVQQQEHLVRQDERLAKQEELMREIMKRLE